MKVAYPTPAMRKLRAYAFDPQASNELDTAMVNEVTISLPWETRWEAPLELGPCNEYLEVIDYDPACKLFYEPVDLNNPVLLAQDGLAPSEGRPQFHQQMVFAVAMKTIRIFERALGRPVFWAKQRTNSKKVGDRNYPDFVRKLRIYPHALREANAYYSPTKTALLFGYFRKSGKGRYQDSGWVFTCLSQDIVAHEVAHAILHGMHRRSVESSNPDSLAFHEGFADIVALFQHFTMPEVVKHELSKSGGNLRDKTLLTGLAAQFGQATGRGGALRYAMEMERREAENHDGEEVGSLENTSEPHARGQFLVAAVFDAFVTIYERRTADLFAMAPKDSQGKAQFSSEFLDRLTREAVKAADHILRMCVRALDYLPPVDVRFGEFLRAIITADTDLVPDDPMKYRVALAEAFRKRGIFVQGAVSMAPDSLMWEDPDPDDTPELLRQNGASGLFGSALVQLKFNPEFNRQYTETSDGLTLASTGYEARHSNPQTEPEEPNYRMESMRIVTENQRKIHDWLEWSDGFDAEWEQLLGLQLAQISDLKKRKARALHSIPRAKSGNSNLPAVEVHSVRLARRQGPDGQELVQLVIQITQKRRGYYDASEQIAADCGELAKTNPSAWQEPDFWFRGGVTLLVDMRDGRLRRVIRKRIDNDQRLAEEVVFRLGDSNASVAMKKSLAAKKRNALRAEPFAFIHRGGS